MTSIGSFTDSLPAALCWTAAWDMCRDAELAARDYLRLVLTGVGSVTDISVAETLLRQGSAALRRYTDPAWRPAGLAQAADGLRELLAQATPGSDLQFGYAQALAGLATSPGDLALLAGLLDGTRQIEGLAVDTEFRWRLLRRLVSRGAAGQDEIEAELRRDPTDAGARRAATCRAAIPDAAAKEAAWQRIISGTLPNAMFRAELAGFTDYDQPGLMVPYQQRYFEVVGGIWRDWGPDMAQWFAANAYPMADTPAVIEATDDLIGRTDPPPALRRLLIEGRDGLERALRCQARDRQAG
jgi:aminopeptidase N